MEQLINIIREDLVFYGGKSFFKKILTILYKNSFQLMLNYRLGSYFLNRESRFARLIVVYLKHRQLKYRNCHFSYEANIGSRLNLPHPVGIVIGKGAIIQSDVTIYQNCTIGQKREGEYPLIDKNVTIFPSSIIIGNIRIGESSIVGAQSFVNKNIAENSVFYSKSNK